MITTKGELFDRCSGNKKQTEDGNVFHRAFYSGSHGDALGGFGLSEGKTVVHLFGFINI